MNWQDMAVVGRVARTHGLRGQVIVTPETDFPHERFRRGAELFINRAGQLERLRIEEVRFHRDRPVVALAGIGDVAEAQQLAGLELRVPRAWLTVLPAGTFYWHDLIGCRVESVDLHPIGVVTGVEGTTGGSRLVVDRAGTEVLIPLATDICRTIDTGARLIVVDPPEGLLELNDAVRHRHDLSGDDRARARRGRRRPGN